MVHRVFFSTASFLLCNTFLVQFCNREIRSLQISANGGLESSSSSYVFNYFLVGFLRDFYFFFDS